MFNKLNEGGEFSTIRICTEEDCASILEYLEQSSYFNVFLLSDISLYGFDKSFQTVYANFENKRINGVYLQFHNNLIVTGSTPKIAFLMQMIRSGVNTCMGPYENISEIQKLTDPEGTVSKKELLMLNSDQMLLENDPEIQVAAEEDTKDILKFLHTEPEYRIMYASESMIHNRIRSGEGTHLILRRDGRIIAHINSAARTSRACMIGGILVRAHCRDMEIAEKMISSLCRLELSQGRNPEIFNGFHCISNIFPRLGFNTIGDWGVISFS